MFCSSLRPGLRRFRADFKGEGIKAFAYMDDITLSLMRVPVNTAEAISFLQPYIA